MLDSSSSKLTTLKLLLVASVSPWAWENQKDGHHMARDLKLYIANHTSVS